MSNLISNATASVTGNLGTKEFQMTSDQVKSVIGGCTANAIKDFTAEHKAMLKQVLLKVRGYVVQSADIIQTRRTVNRSQMQALTKERDSLASGEQDVSDFHRLFAPAIAACQEANNTFQASKSLADTLFSERIELDYRILLKSTLDQSLVAESSEAQDTLSNLDRILPLLG